MFDYMSRYLPHRRTSPLAALAAVGSFATLAVQSAHAHANGEPYAHAAKESGFASCAEFSVSLFSHWLFSAPHFGVIWLATLLAAPFMVGKVVRKARSLSHKEDSATGDALPRVS